MDKIIAGMIETNKKMDKEIEGSLQLIADEIKWIRTLKKNIKENKAFIRKEEERLK